MTRAEPLVTIVTPCYNSADSLKLAIASALSQTYENWELIVVDDGSTDDPGSVVARAGDARMRCVRFAENRGRPFARQAALDQAEGDYLAMLDADDWYYPDKLAEQIRVVLANPECVAVGTRMAITDSKGQLAGVRGLRGATGADISIGAFDRLGMPPIPHAPSLIRMADAKRETYDTRFPLAQDMDFMLRVMLGKRYAAVPKPYYVYTELASSSPQKILLAHRFVRRMFWKHRHRFPLAAYGRILESYVKTILYLAAFKAGRAESVVRGRAGAASMEEGEAFVAARDTVRAVYARIYGAEAQGAGD
jgi:glycosyltransferase involved in cell wall biosynthesis